MSAIQPRVNESPKRIPDGYTVVALDHSGNEYRSTYRYFHNAQSHADRVGFRFVRFENHYYDPSSAGQDGAK